MSKTIPHIWSTADLPSQKGKRAIITGTGGLGYETALALAAADAEVILAGRNEAKGREALEKILVLSPKATIRFEMLDLASLKSIAAFTGRMISECRPIDILVNNAAVMSLPKRQLTEDGFEMQFGTNYLGHYALTAQLLPLLKTSSGAHVVNLSSLAHRTGKIDFTNLQGERRYRPWAAYCQSKLAMLMFAFELQRQGNSKRWGLMSNAAHPGYARTDLIPNGPGTSSLLSRLSLALQPFFSHSAADGALPTLYAAASREARGSGYYGPQGFYEMKGPVSFAQVAKQAKDQAAAKRLWTVSQELTGVAWTG